jgi:hypothetical protein
VQAPSDWTLRRGYAIVFKNKKETPMPGNPGEMITTAERRFPVRSASPFRPAVSASGTRKSPPGSTRSAERTGGAMTPSGTRGALNDALSIHFADATLASTFAARWCVATRVQTTGGVFQVREDEPSRGSEWDWHRTP